MILPAADRERLAACATLGDLQRTGVEILSQTGSDSAAVDARLLLGMAAGLDRTALFSKARDAVSDAVREVFTELLSRRLTGEPVSRIRGFREFHGLDLTLNQDTLDPRPDTETLVEAALDLLPEAGAASPPLVVDLGTGTGAILLALLKARPDLQGVGGDISTGAIDCAQANAHRLGLADRARFIVGGWADILTAVPAAPALIVSNPPYIPTGDIAGLEPDVRQFDPARALDGGTDGLDAYREIVPLAAQTLASGGWLAVEVGIGQAADVAAMMAAAGLVAGLCLRDLAGVDRVVCARRS